MLALDFLIVYDESSGSFRGSTKFNSAGSWTLEGLKGIATLGTFESILPDESTLD